jgi:hypothetical protein
MSVCYYSSQFRRLLTGLDLFLTFIRNVRARRRKIAIGTGENVKLSLVHAMKTCVGAEV